MPLCTLVVHKEDVPTTRIYEGLILRAIAHGIADQHHIRSDGQGGYVITGRHHIYKELRGAVKQSQIEKQIRLEKQMNQHGLKGEDDESTKPSVIRRSPCMGAVE